MILYLQSRMRLLAEFTSVQPIPTQLPGYLIHLMSGLLLTGAVLLSGALYLVRKLIHELPKSASRRWWHLLGGLILLFVAGYLGFFALTLGGSYSSSEMLVVVIFFLGSVFALLVCLLAYRTTRDLKRIYILEQEAITDPLMGIFNRRCLDRRLRDEVLRSQRHDLDLALLMVDLDRFKLVNDTWGHATGDLVLRHVARLLVDSLRQTDVVARYGGEEIVILLPHTPAAEAYEVAERLRDAVEKNPMPLEGINNGVSELAVTVSIGCASLLPLDDTQQSLLKRADQAMYQAKRQGRNQVVRAGLEHADEAAGCQVA